LVTLDNRLMDRHAQIDVFSLAAHRLALDRLRKQPERISEALGVLARWRGMTSRSPRQSPAATRTQVGLQPCCVIG
jgi:hypothetical protein